MRMRSLRLLAACLLICACSHPAATSPPAHAAARRGRARGGPRDAALSAAQARASQCLRADDGVGVEGNFDGATGRFRVVRVIGLATPEIEQCVTEAFEEARVEPFSAVSPEENVFVTAPGTTDDAREALYRAVNGHGSDEDPRGAIDAAAVTATVRQEDPAIRQCYEAERARTPALEGAIRVRMRIGLDGRVDRAASEGPPRLRAVGECVVGRLRALSWPRPRRAAVTFLLPFVFAPGG